MFLLVPLSIFGVSIIAISYIVLRKFSYLKKLSTDPETAGVGDITFFEFGRQMFPELFSYFSRVDMAGHKSSLLIEFEKFLRRTRIFFLRVENASNSLIHKIRDSNFETNKSSQKIETRELDSTTEVETDPILDLNKKEHELIIEIAKNPKNASLYKTLADIYIQMRQWDDARDSILSAIKLNPNILGVKRKLDVINKMIESRGH